MGLLLEMQPSDKSQFLLVIRLLAGSASYIGILKLLFLSSEHLTTEGKNLRITICKLQAPAKAPRPKGSLWIWQHCPYS